ncbi:hypothetical protein [Saccharopolyspora rosea]|uniref:hypothetical protein n=1 Tax=Saccharopolyspora rosea TaxID=524884 RepID=UPI0021D9A163|nr:hypothetical protein [Saccharopolyspora rosea]
MVVILIALVVHSGFHALSCWPIWLVLAAYLAFLVYASRSEVLTAGADWMKFRRRWVPTYELTSIQLVPRGANGHELILEDSHGRAVGITPYLLQANRRLWDLVYLGMRYSAANGATIDRTARGAFPEVAAASLRGTRSADQVAESDKL